MDSRKLEKINKHLQRLIGEIILREAEIPPGTLVTVSRVETAYNMRGAEVFLYIYPTPEAERVAEALREQLYELQGFLNNALDVKVVPRIRFTVDYGADHAATIEQRFAELQNTDARDSGEEKRPH